MKKVILFSVSLVIGVALIVWIYQHIGLRGALLKFSDLLLWQMVALFLLALFKVVFWVARWWVVLKMMGFSNLSFRKLAAARLGEFAISYLTPGIYWGGEGIRIFALKNNFNIPLSKGLTSIILDRLFDVIGFCFFIFIGIVVFFFERNLNAVLFLGLLILLPSLLLIFIFKFPGLERILSFLARIFRLEKIEYIKRNKESLRRVGRETVDFFRRPLLQVGTAVILTILGFFAGVCQIIFFLAFLGEHFSLFNSMIMKILIVISGFIPLPANLGALEGTNVLVFQGFHFTAETGLGFSLITRLVDFSFVILGILILIYYFGNYLFSKIMNNKKNNNGLMGQ